MNKSLALCAMVAAVLMGSGCSYSSAVTVGAARPPILPENVKLYLRPPARYEEMALINANNAWGSPFGQQAKVNTVINRMKARAAKMGANGLLITNIADQSIGTLDHSIINASVYGNTLTGYSSGMSTNMMLKIGSAIAIHVP